MTHCPATGDLCPDVSCDTQAGQCPHVTYSVQPAPPTLENQLSECAEMLMEGLVVMCPGIPPMDPVAVADFDAYKRQFWNDVKKRRFD